MPRAYYIYYYYTMLSHNTALYVINVQSYHSC